MKVTFKTVQGTTFPLEVEPDVKVGDVKATIESQQGANFPAANQLLIYQGKVLKDDTTFADAGVTEAGFVVVMVTKTKPKAEPKPEPAAAPTDAGTSAAAPAATATVAPTAAPAATQAPAEAAPAAAAVPAPATTAAAGDSASELLVGPALEEKIGQICEMGFERSEVQRAMRAAFNNAERAVEYLMTGIPESADAPAVPIVPGTVAPAAAGAAAPPAPAAGGPNAAQPLDMFGGAGAAVGGAAGGAAGAGNLDFLRSNPQFQALRQYVQANPQILQPMLQELGKQNPQLLALINSNQAEFLRLIVEPPAAAGGGSGGGGMAADLAAQLGNMVGDEGGEGEGGGAPMGMQISVTPEEKEAIDRLEALGFDRGMCIEAFFACDKNEALAANYLLENAGDEMQ